MLISTGKSDWPHDVASETGSLAAYLSDVIHSAPKSKPVSNTSSSTSPPSKPVPGVYDPSSVSKITVLNGSHRTVCDDPTYETVLVLPDYKVVTRVERSKEGATQLWHNAVDPAVGRVGAAVEGGSVHSWVLPYTAVILLCKCWKVPVCLPVFISESSPLVLRFT